MTSTPPSSKRVGGIARHSRPPWGRRAAARRTPSILKTEAAFIAALGTGKPVVTDSARRRAEACFAVARSATIPGERAAAIDRGTALAERAGLSLDLFEIPGRSRARVPDPPRSRYVDDLFERSRAPDFANIDPDEFMREMVDLLRRSRSRCAEPDLRTVREEMERRAADKCGPCRGSGFASGRVNHGRICPFCSGQGTTS